MRIYYHVLLHAIPMLHVPRPLALLQVIIFARNRVRAFANCSLTTTNSLALSFCAFHSRRMCPFLRYLVAPSFIISQRPYALSVCAL